MSKLIKHPALKGKALSRYLFLAYDAMKCGQIRKVVNQLAIIKPVLEASGFDFDKYKSALFKSDRDLLSDLEFSYRRKVEQLEKSGYFLKFYEEFNKPDSIKEVDKSKEADKPKEYTKEELYEAHYRLMVKEFDKSKESNKLNSSGVSVDSSNLLDLSKVINKVEDLAGDVVHYGKAFINPIGILKEYEKDLNKPDLNLRNKVYSKLKELKESYLSNLRDASNKLEEYLKEIEKDLNKDEKALNDSLAVCEIVKL